MICASAEASLLENTAAID